MLLLNVIVGGTMLAIWESMKMDLMQYGPHALPNGIRQQAQGKLTLT